MNFKIKYALVIIFLCNTAAKAQNLSVAEKKDILHKYSSTVVNSKINGENLVLVELARPLTSAEIQELKPLRSFSLNHLIIQEKMVNKVSSILISQTKANSLWKASDKLVRQYEQYLTQNKQFTIRIAINPLISTIAPTLQALKAYTLDQPNHIITASIQMSELMAILQLEEVIFADIIQAPKDEILIKDLDLSVNQIAAVQLRYPDINGKGITLSLKEQMIDITDIDLIGNLVASPSHAPMVDGHATNMATLAVGRGNSYILGLGAAPFTSLTTSDYRKNNDDLMPDDIKELNQYKVNVQNHSYGLGVDNYYGMQAAAYDKQVFESDTIIHVFSAGNSGLLTPEDGIYKNIPITANLTGNFKTAKNVIVVGGIGLEDIPEPRSSRGPAYDGRVKPEIVALGQDGTSGAAALTSGTVAIFQQKYKSLFGKQPSLAIVKSIFVNTADDIGTPQVDYVTGFGKLNALQAIQTIIESRFKTGTINDQQDYTFQLQVPTDQQELKVTLAWIDPPAIINNIQGIVNHLDLSMETPAGTVIRPWILSTYPSADSLSLPAKRGIDNINTVQQLSLTNVPAGNYTIHVKGRTVTQSKQDFSIAYQLKSIGSFSWTFPLKDAAIFASQDNYVRWASTLAGQTGKLSVSYDNGTNWTVLSSNINFNTSFFKWTVPNLFTRALLKMETGGKEYTTESFVVSPPQDIKVGYNCADKILFHWSPQPLATGYTLYNLKDNTLQAIKQLTDTVVIINKSEIAGPYFTVAANGANFTGIKSETKNYNTQGVACYVRTFQASIVDDAGKLDLVIGTTYNLKRIIWEKQTALGVFAPLAESVVTSGLLNYSQTDKNLVRGIQFYRVTLETTDGIKIPSDILPLNFLKENDFATYPNPVTDFLSVLSGDFEPYTLSLYNLSGQKIFLKEANGLYQFDLSALSTGLYIGTITRNGNTLKKIKIIKR
ncbi:S8 family peptidase [Pedobacter sp. PAMC26386]|nr:S8 family peptidase [Pedobacter sp. PAMC26386]